MSRARAPQRNEPPAAAGPDLHGLADRLRAAAPELRTHGIAALSLFGSTARGEAKAGSDVDILIDLQPGQRFSLFDLGEVRVRLSELLGRQVDLLVREDLRPDLRQRIEADLVPVF
jgi:uncharacterized protein